MENKLSLLKEIERSPFGVHRIFMTKDEIKLCNKMVKDGLLYKSYPSEKNTTIAFFITQLGVEYLEENAL